MIKVCLMTCPSLEVAQGLARNLLERHLVACVNLLPQVSSLYWWEGRIQQDTEILLLAKTTVNQIDALKTLLPTLHPYEVPEFLVLSAEDSLPAYKDWVQQMTSGFPSGEAG